MESHDRDSNLEQPLTGLNYSLYHLGREIHIQTEDLGNRERTIETQVFCEGRVILSTRTQYPLSVQPQDGREPLADLMRKQHYGVIRELEVRLNR